MENEITIVCSTSLTLLTESFFRLLDFPVLEKESGKMEYQITIVCSMSLTLPSAEPLFRLFEFAVLAKESA